MRAPLLCALAGAGSLVVLGARRYAADARAAHAEAALLAPDADAERFSEAHLDRLPEAAQRYLRHAIAPGTPLAPAVRLEMSGSMTPTPGGPPTTLTAVEVLAPRCGFVWTARARMNGLPVHVRDHYVGGAGGVSVTALGLVPVLLGIGQRSDVTRSSRGRLVAEAVWCPTALVHPDVMWEAVDPDRARYTLTVDGEAVPVMVRVDADGALREVTLMRWGDADGPPARPLPYGFRVEAERTFGDVTLPSRLVGGWLYGTDRFDPSRAASFTVHRARFV